MPRSDSWFKPGQSGNPAGRPKGRSSARDAVRRALEKPTAADPETSTLEAWAAGIVEAAVTVEDRMSVLRWLEGASPPTQGPLAMIGLGMTHEEALEELDRGMKVEIAFVHAPVGSLALDRRDDEPASGPAELDAEPA